MNRAQALVIPAEACPVPRYGAGIQGQRGLPAPVIPAKAGIHTPSLSLRDGEGAGGEDHPAHPGILQILVQTKNLPL